MAFLFGGAARPRADPVREQQQEVRRAMRAMDREEARAAAADRALVAEITRCARAQRLVECRAKARDLVRARAHRSRMAGMRSHLASLAQQLETLKGTQQIHRVMEQTTALMTALNRRVNPRSVHKVLAEFERQNAAFAAGQEVLTETLDTVFEADDEQEASDEALSSVFAELGLSEAAGLRPAQAAGAGAADDAEIHRRLAGLRAAS